MQDLIVGSKDKWSDYAGYLRIPCEDIEKLRLDLLHDKINRNDILKKILHIWVADQGSNAKLAELIRVVEDECGDKSVGDKLRHVNNLSSQNGGTTSIHQGKAEQYSFKHFPQIPNGIQYCSMHDVWVILCKSYLVKEKWSDFAGFLQIPIEEIERLREGLLLKKFDHNYVLNQILILWVGHQARNAQLAELIRVVEEDCGDISAGEKLRLAHNLPCKNFQNNTNWATLPFAFQKKAEESILDFFPNITIQKVKLKLEGDILLDLVTGKKPNLFNSSIPPSPIFYLKRTLLPRHTISENVFNTDAPDIFLFTGLNEFELGKLVKTHDTSTSDEQLDSSKIHVRFLVLKLKTHFQKICKKVKANIPVHLLSYDKNSEKLEWVQTHGSVNVIQRFIEGSKNPLSEEQFMDYLEKKSIGPVLISDSPGMGKSFLLANIALALEKRGDKIVIFISANDFIKQVKGNHGYNKPTIDSIQGILQSLICMNELAIMEFPILLSMSDVKIELLLDGFDEVSMTDTALALDTIKIINETFKSIRLWITTRPHYLEKLENELGVFGYNIKGFDEDNQVQFLISHWQHLKSVQNESLDKSRLELYAQRVLRTTKSKLNKDDNDIAGAPLRCLLIGEVFEEDCISFASESNDSLFLPTIRINSITDLYEKMITKKFKKYIKIHVRTEFAGLDNIFWAHVDLSIKLLFSDHHPKLDYIQVDFEDLLNIGIIQASSPTGSTHFIHRTFAEYFVAGYVVEKLSAKTFTENSEFVSFFLEEIMMRKEYLLHILSESSNITSYKFIHQIIGYFVNDCFAHSALPLLKAKIFIEEPATRKEISHACANSSFLQIFKLFVSQEHYDPDETIVLLVIRNSTFEYFTFILSSFGNNLGLFNQSQLSNFLRVAVQRSEPTMVKFLVRRERFRELIENVNESTKLLLHDCVSNSKYTQEDDVEKRMGVIQLLFEINADLLEAKDGFGRTPLLREYVHVDLLKELIRLGADVTSQDMMGDTILHLSENKTRRFNANEYHSLITSIPKSKLEQVLKEANYKETPLVRLMYYIDPTKETLDILYQKQTDSVEMALFVAIGVGRNSFTLENLIKLGVDMSWRGQEGESFLHVASRFGNMDAINLLIKNYYFDANVRDDSLLTPMDHAILSNEGSRVEAAKALYNLGGKTSEKISSQQQLVLNKAIKDGNAESISIIQDILDFGNKHVESKICSTPERNQSFDLSEEQFELLVKNFLDANTTAYRDSDGKSLLHLAAERGDELAVKELVGNGADLNDRDLFGNTPLHKACFCRDLNIGIVKYLIDNGADAYATNDDNFTLVHQLLARGSFINSSQFHEITEYLAEKNLVNVLFNTPTGPGGYTSLQEACDLLELEEKTIMILHKKGVSINHLDTKGKNVLMYAIMGGRSEAFLNLLIHKFNASWMHRDTQNSNCLHIAAEYGHLEAVKLLIDLGLDINQVNAFDDTPLHRVAKFGKRNILDAAKILIEAGVDITKKDGNGQVVLDVLRIRKLDDNFDNKVRDEFANMLTMPNVTTNASILTANKQFAVEIRELLHEAVRGIEIIDSCLDVIKSLIRTEADVYAKDLEGDTFLHKLFLKKLVPSQLHDISKYLLDFGHKDLFQIPGGVWGATALHYTVRYFEPKLETLQLLKSHGINFNRSDDHGNSLLIYAVHGKRSIEFLSLLITEFGVSWKRLSNSKQNLLHAAAQVGYEDALKHFLNLGLNINARDEHGSTPMFYAIQHAGDNILAMLQLLLDNGADINAKNNQGHTNLYRIAFMTEHSKILPVIQFLIENGADVFAVDCENFTFLHILVQKIDGTCPITPLIFHQLVQYLIECDNYKLLHYPGGEYDTTPAQFALMNLEVQKDTLSYLYSTKSDINYINKSGCSSLSYAISGKQSRKLCQELVDLGADVAQKSVFGESLLHVSSFCGILEVVELFVELGLDVNGMDNFERTPLHFAVLRQDSDVAVKVVKHLIENGANPNLSNSKGCSPLYLAINQATQSLPVINCLIGYGAHVDSLNFHKTSYIHLAAEIGGVEVLKLFLIMKVLDVNAVDLNGDTPLHCAVQQTESDFVLEKVRILLECSADANIKNEKGQTALAIAEERTEWDEGVRNELRILLRLS